MDQSQHQGRGWNIQHPSGPALPGDRSRETGYDLCRQ
jgi:hypothetical protein